MCTHNKGKLVNQQYFLYIQPQHMYILSQQIPVEINAQVLWGPEWLIKWKIQPLLSLLAASASRKTHSWV